MQADVDGYRDGFFRGVEFVLLAMEGRLAASDLPAREAEALRRFLREYQSFLEAHEGQDRGPRAVTVTGQRFDARLPAGSRN